jgi:restriction system protein
MINAWCVRAEFGTYTSAFLEGGYVAIGWLKKVDLSSIKTRQELYPLYKDAYPNDTSNIVIGIQVGQIARFLLEMISGDVVITPDPNTELLRHGVISGEPSYFFDPDDQKCPYPHRRRVVWSGKPILRSSLSVPLQNTLRSSLTVFNIAPAEEIVRAAGHAAPASVASGKAYDPYEAVLEPRRSRARRPNSPMPSP